MVPLPVQSFTTITSSPEQTEALAHLIAPHLSPGDALLLSGPVGAGKSVFARALIRALLPESRKHEDIPSPSFTLVQEYQGSAGPVWHIDLYRLSDPSEGVELGLEEAFTQAISVVEWPERLGSLTPDNATTIRIEPDLTTDSRTISFAGLRRELSSLLADFDPGERE